MIASKFTEALAAHRTEKDQVHNTRFYKGGDTETRVMGVRFGTVFLVAKQFVGMPLGEIERLLEREFYEVRMGAVSIMDFKAQQKKITGVKDAICLSCTYEVMTVSTIGIW